MTFKATAKRGELKIATGDMSTVLTRSRLWRESRFELMFADPPYNIDRDYHNGYDDRQPDWAFEATLAHWCRIMARGIKPGGHVVVVLPPKLSPHAFMALRAAGLEWVNTVAWCYRFGQHQRARFISAHVDAVVFTKPGAPRIWNPSAVEEPSDRATKYDDPRVKLSKHKGMRPPLDWLTGPYLGRIQGANIERSAAHDNQLPERFVATMVLALTNPGGAVCDPFTGSGTTGAVCNTTGRQFFGVELGEQQARQAWQRIKRGAARADRISSWNWNDERTEQ